MNLDLLDTPARRNSILPELVKFFKREFGDDWRPKTEKFLRRFAGCEFQIPGHDAIAEMDRDSRIVAALTLDDSIARRIELMREHKLTHHYLQTIYSCVHGKPMQPPAVHTRQHAIREAAEWMRKYPLLAGEIVGMYSLTAPDCAAAMELVPGEKAREISYKAISQKKKVRAITKAPAKKKSKKVQTRRR